MASNWQETSLGSISVLKNGKGLNATEYRDDGLYPVWGANGPIARTNHLLNSDPVIVIGRVGAYCGSVHLVSESSWVTDNAIVATPKEGNDHRFLYYLLRFIRPERTSIGSAQPLITQSGLKPLRCKVPPTEDEQRAIATVLGTLDDKIELSRQMSRSLEEIARAIFKSWFVNFDPVRAKAEGRDPALPKHIADLFPASFQDSEVGDIPNGWALDRLSRHIDSAKGLSYKGAHLCDEADGMALHNLNSVYEGGGYKYEGIKWYSGDYKDRHIAYPGELLITNTEQGFNFLLIGYSAIVPDKYEEGLFSHHLYRVRPKDSTHLTPLFFYHLMRDGRFHRLVAGYTNGTTVNMLPADGLEKPRFVVPPESIHGRFDDFAQLAQARAEVVHEENRSLAAIRNALLPRLISGELGIPDAERIVGRVV